jgi:hypothetical protein
MKSEMFLTDSDRRSYHRMAKAIAEHPDPDSLEITEAGWQELESNGYYNPRCSRPSLHG